MITARHQCDTCSKLSDDLPERGWIHVAASRTDNTCTFNFAVSVRSMGVPADKHVALHRDLPRLDFCSTACLVKYVEELMEIGLKKAATPPTVTYSKPTRSRPRRSARRSATRKSR